MIKTMVARIGELIGVGGARGAHVPRYVALADGLLVTDTAAEAWFVLKSSNTDLMSESARDAELDLATQALSRILVGRDCHLRVLWSPLRADNYLDEAQQGLFTAGRWEGWAQERVERLDALALPARHLLLGVRVADRSVTAGHRAQEALGVDGQAVGRAELAHLDATVRQLGRRLADTPWRAEIVTVEMLAWMAARDQQRDSMLPAPTGAGVISGAPLAALSRGRAVPYPDHLRLHDRHGRVAAWTSVLTMTGFPEEMEVPGAGEWLRTLSEITYVPALADIELDAGGGQELILPANAEASVRFRVLPGREALRRVEDQRKLAAEQRTSAAAHSVGDAGVEIGETEGRMATLARDMRRDGVVLVQDQPRVLVTSHGSLEDLRARVEAVVDHYGTAGIDVTVGEEEQRELWLESLPGDRVRVADLGHTRTTGALAGSWWWGGSQVGDDEGPICGYLTGSTPGVVRVDVTAGSERGDATSTAWIGRSGRGKTTSMALSLLDAGFRGAFVLGLDFKGDMGGLVRAGQHYGLNAHLIQTNARFAGAADLFQLLSQDGAERAAIEVPAQLGIAIPPHLRARGAETPIVDAVTRVLEQPDPATWRVIEHLERADDELARETGEALAGLARTPLGAPFLGRPAGRPPLVPEPGIFVIQIPGLSLPQPSQAREDWSVLQRMSVALMHSMLAFGVATAGRRDLLGLRKVVAIPEVHVLTATREGQAFLEYIARVGRALNTALLIDTQDPAGIVQLVGLVEQLTTVFGFQLTTGAQQDALAELLDLPVSAHTRALIRAVGVTADQEIRKGHCIARDRRFQAATMQWDIPTRELMELLDTSPAAAAQADAVALNKTVEAPA